MSGIVGVQDKLLHQVTCGVKQDVLENKNTQFKVAFVPCLHRPVCSSAIYGKHWGRNMQIAAGLHPDTQISWLSASWPHRS